MFNFRLLYVWIPHVPQTLGYEERRTLLFFYHITSLGRRLCSPQLSCSTLSSHGCGISWPTRFSLLQYVYTAEQLAKHDANHTQPWIAILGEVYDVSKAKNYYGTHLLNELAPTSYARTLLGSPALA
jgi:hypothetical protein